MKSKRILSAMIAATLMMSAFAGCAKKDSGSGTTAEKPKQTTIKLATWDNSSNPTVNNVIKAFEEKNPNVKVEIIDTPGQEFTNKLSIMLNGGSDVDAFYIKDADTTFSMNKKNQLADLTSYIQKDKVDLAQYNGLADNFKFDNKVVGMPVRTDYYVLYYNKDLFDKAKVAYPTNNMTWKQFEETAKKLTSGEGATKKYGALIHTWQACVQNWGVQDGKNTIIAKDYSFFKPYYEMALRMQNTDKSIMDFATMKTSNIHYSGPFLNGDVAMMPMGTWFMATLIDKKNAGESKVNWGVATIPHGDGIEAGYTVGATTPLAINEASKKKDAAWDYVKFATSIDGADVLSKAGQIPAISNEKTLANVAAVKGMPEGLTDALKVKKISLDRPIADKVLEINKMLGEEHGLIMLGEVKLDEGLSKMAKRAAEILK